MTPKITHGYAARNKDGWRMPKTTRIYPTKPINVAKATDWVDWRFGQTGDCFFDWDIGLEEGECKEVVVILRKDYERLLKSHNKEKERARKRYEARQQESY